ncbi:enoyl-CoA hydratase-related protein [Deinococcus maricopensis]|uniref:Enoyl-CoA hydratase/isomerase n=1 Tax=Deinococcus maricopensis (strain DSM 21211 / LMG 22137 / NRRL B-23946 / LB-34) TaxID=709986 RepID=E8UC65_DEIML|nr:enoyl-CoA hydratase-related protein [Deinococcus maricopensis]ADV68726.1 Enoyl-CoA hydratase/isomerase [Deinococcus maricopensis DSM 21211]
MTSTTVHVARSGPVATLTLASKRGAFGPAFWRDLPAALADLGDARALIIRGQAGTFSVGLDLHQTAPIIAAALPQDGEFLRLVDEMQQALNALAALPIPVIAAVDGWCIGAGLELISACDVRLATTSARFSLPEVTLGIVADLGGLSRLPPLIGLGRTQHLALTGDPIDAPTALNWGLVTELHDTEDALLTRAETLAARLAALPPRAAEGTKRTLNAHLPHADSLRHAAQWNADHLDLNALGAHLQKLSRSNG